MPAVSHGLAWTGHFFVEKNAPATFRYPLQGLLANVHMYRLMWAARGNGLLQASSVIKGTLKGTLYAAPGPPAQTSMPAGAVLV